MESTGVAPWAVAWGLLACGNFHWFDFMKAKSSLLDDRTKAFALRIIKVVENLPNTRTASVLGSQLLRCGTSVGANYRAACRGRSPAEFCAKLGIVEEEADESLYWMELLTESGTISSDRLEELTREASEIISMVVASIQTTKRRQASTNRSAK